MIVGISMVKNEADIIEAFVRHNLHFIDLLVVVDHDSEDSTYEILRKLCESGLPVVSFQSFVPGYPQAKIMTSLARKLVSFVSPEYIVPLDADEFILCESRTKFENALSTIPQKGYGLYSWKTYVVSPEDISDGKFAGNPVDFRYRRRNEDPSYEKAILCPESSPWVDFSIEMGSHRVCGSRGESLPCVTLNSVSLAHLPVRNADQITVKSTVSWMKRISNNSLAEGSDVCYQWRELNEVVRKSGTIPLEALPALSMGYAQNRKSWNWDEELIDDPLGPRLKYDSDEMAFSSGIDPVKTIANSWYRSISSCWPPKDRFLQILTEGLAADSLKTASKTLPDSALSAQWHRDNLFVDLPVLEELKKRYSPTSVIDIGCGLGTAPLYFHHHGVDNVLGVDLLEPSHVLLESDQYLQADVTSVPFDENADLVVCTEVCEHLQETKAQELIRVVARAAKRVICFSAGEPGQPGSGHINCRPIGYWLDLFKKEGWVPSLRGTSALRVVSSLSWLSRNGVVLLPLNSLMSNDDGTDMCENVGRHSFVWPTDRRGIQEVVHMIDEDRSVFSEEQDTTMVRDESENVATRHLLDENVRLRGEIEKIKASTCWKITKPVRTLKHLFSGAPRNIHSEISVQNQSLEDRAHFIEPILRENSVVLRHHSLKEQLSNVEGWLHEPEGYLLHRLAEDGPGAGAIVEIGSFKGKSTICMALGSKRSKREHVYAVDHFLGSKENRKGGSHEDPTIAETLSSRATFDRNISDHGVSDYIRILAMTSLEAAQTWTLPIRLLFIDGDHEYASAKEDFQAWSPFVVKHGLIAFHDVGGWPGVTKFYEELMAENSKYTEVFCCCSIRVIQKF